jgi:hypothetical protein
VPKCGVGRAAGPSRNGARNRSGSGSCAPTAEQSRAGPESTLDFFLAEPKGDFESPDRLPGWVETQAELGGLPRAVGPGGTRAAVAARGLSVSHNIQPDPAADGEPHHPRLQGFTITRRRTIQPPSPSPSPSSQSPSSDTAFHTSPQWAAHGQSGAGPSIHVWRPMGPADTSSGSWSSPAAGRGSRRSRTTTRSPAPTCSHSAALDTASTLPGGLFWIWVSTLWPLVNDSNRHALDIDTSALNNSRRPGRVNRHPRKGRRLSQLRQASRRRDRLRNPRKGLRLRARGIVPKILPLERGDPDSRPVNSVTAQSGARFRERAATSSSGLLPQGPSSRLPCPEAQGAIAAIAKAASAYHHPTRHRQWTRRQRLWALLLPPITRCPIQPHPPSSRPRLKRSLMYRPRRHLRPMGLRLQFLEEGGIAVCEPRSPTRDCSALESIRRKSISPCDTSGKESENVRRRTWRSGLWQGGSRD